ncbi:MAG: ABC transporter ATP-binding protein [Deltaproteobacteria bacterium]|nr:MAG: ABC transporter ATP-binding protein [Deltaproteobacteria bacterium]
MSAVLRTDRLSRSWGALQAVRQVSFSLESGARHALIGPNGAGKTTLVNLLTGTVPPQAGDVFLDDERITHLPQHLRVKRGMTRTFQITTLFPGLTALESVLLAICERKGLGASWWRPVARHAPEIEEARRILRDLHLEAEAEVATRSLPYGKQRLLEIAVALASRPRVLLLDEPAAGIPVGESAEIFGVLASLPREVTILFIEHDMNLVFRFAERITVLVEGSILVEGAPQEIAANPRVREVYLGEGGHG